MANDINSVILIGRLTRDSELKFLGNGTAVCRFSLAVNRVKGSGEQKEEEVSYFDVTLWGKAAEKAEDPTPVQPVEPEKPEPAQTEPSDKEYWDNLDKKYQRDLPFITALQSFFRRIERGDILATCMLVDESRGIFRIDFEKK